MTLDAFLHILINSRTDDWYRIPCASKGCGPSYYYRLEAPEEQPEEGNNHQAGPGHLTGTHTSVATYRPDLSITMAWGMTTGPDCDRNEPWTTSYPDPRPGPCYLLDFFYSGSLVFRTTYCQPEEAGYKLPYPDAKMTVPRRYADVIKKLNEMEGRDSFYPALEEAGVELTDTPWPA